MGVVLVYNACEQAPCIYKHGVIQKVIQLVRIYLRHGNISKRKKVHQKTITSISFHTHEVLNYPSLRR